MEERYSFKKDPVDKGEAGMILVTGICLFA